jgi:sigma-B regulation protein RsbU (phosphoserine phosphatase)
LTGRPPPVYYDAVRLPLPEGKEVGLDEQLSAMRRDMAALREQLKHLSSLIEVSHVINSTLELTALLTIIMDIAKTVMRCEASSLMLIDDTTHELVFKVALGDKGKTIKEQFRLKMGQGIAGWCAQHEQSVLVPDAAKDKRFFSGVDKKSGFQTRSVLCVPLKVKGHTIGILEAFNPTDRPMFGEDDLSLFEAFASQAAVAVENARMHEHIVRQRVVEQELEIASQIQRSFLPTRFPAVPGLSFAAVSEPARNVGGDLYDVIELGGGRVGVVIGDVAGKGVPAALFMVKAMSGLRFHTSSSASTAEVLQKANELTAESELGVFITMVYLVLDARTGRVEYTNAGHTTPLVVRPGLDRVILLEEGRNLPLGVAPGVEFAQGEFRLEPGDTVFLDTDGILEARNPKGEEYGEARLTKLLAGKDLVPDELIQAVRYDVACFTLDQPQHDDLTALAARYDGA